MCNGISSSVQVCTGDGLVDNPVTGAAPGRDGWREGVERWRGGGYGPSRWVKTLPVTSPGQLQRVPQVITPAPGDPPPPRPGRDPLLYIILTPDRSHQRDELLVCKGVLLKDSVKEPLEMFSHVRSKMSKSKYRSGFL